MNLLYVESSKNWGGQEYRTCLEINWLNANGHQAWLICTPGGAVFNRAQELGVRLVPMSLRQRYNLFRSLQILRFCRRNAVDVINTYSSKDHWLCLPLRAAGIPVTRSRCITNPIGKGSRALIFKHGCDKVLVDAAVIKQNLVAYGVAAEKVEVVGSGVDLEKFNPERDRMKFRKELGLDAHTPLVVNIGMIRHDKGQQHFVEAAFEVLRRRPDIRFVLVGEGTGDRALERELRERIRNAGLEKQIFMVGYRWDTPDILAACDALVIASIGTEASPIVLREALASRKVFIGTRVGDIPEMIQHRQNGLLVEPGSGAELAQSILDVFSDPEMARCLAERGYELARREMSFEAMVRKKLAIYAALKRK